MSSIEVRPFSRADRDQLTALVSAHAAAVVPGIRVSVNAVLSQLEREPDEFIVDPWVAGRATLVAEQRGRIVAAAHLLRYRSDDDVGESYRGAGEIRWFLFWPAAPFWPDAGDAADVLISGCLAELDRWGVMQPYADGSLPAPGVYGVPEQWPHVQAIYERAGFVHDGRSEVVYLAAVDDLPRRPAQPEGLSLRRSLGANGTRLSAVEGEDVIGFVEVETLDDGGRLAQNTGWADVGNLLVEERHRRRGIATWLLGQAAEWLHLARVDRLLAYAGHEQEDCTALFAASGFRELTRTKRGWVRRP